MALLLCILGGLMVMIGAFASIVSYSGAVDAANTGGSGKYTLYGGIIVAGLVMFFRGIYNTRR